MGIIDSSLKSDKKYKYFKNPVEAKPYYFFKNAMALAGNAGSGKTTIIRALDFLLDKKLNLSNHPILTIAPEDVQVENLNKSFKKLQSNIIKIGDNVVSRKYL